MPFIVSEYDDLDKYKDDFGDIFYYKKGTNIQHNQYGPAFISRDGYIAYIINNKWHRLDGPARIFTSGNTAYYINGEFLNQEEFEMHPERLKYLGKEYLTCLI